jgi:hypothetical protein
MENRHKGLGFGVFLLTLGILWILINTGVVTWSIIDALFVFWPLIIVIIGVNIIFRRNSLIKAGAWIVFLAVLISYSYFVEDKNPSDSNFAVGGTVSIDRQAETRKAELRLALGGTKINLDSNTGKLLEASIQDKEIKYSSGLQENDGKAYITFEKNRYTFDDLKFEKNKGNSFHLNREVIWNLDFDTGAIDGNFDMSGLKVENLDLKVGAANTRLVMGSYDTKLKIGAGASKIDIEIPQNAGIKVKLDGGLNDTNMDEPGWEKRGDWHYSPGYDGKEFKLEANVSMGVGKFTVISSR